MNFETILVEDAQGIRTLTLNRPDKLNAINYDVISELEEVINRSQFEDQVRVIILKGAGKAFCVGDDLKGMGTDKHPFPEDHMINRVDMGYPRLVLSIRRLGKPVICFAHRFALGAGCDLALACDMIFAPTDTKFGLVFSKRGLVGGTALLPQIVGYQKTCEILFSGKHFNAFEAKEMGIVNYVGSSYQEVQSMVDEWANKFAHAPTSALGLMKRSINQCLGENLERSIDIQKYITMAMYHTQDQIEGKDAFREKREPKFIGK